MTRPTLADVPRLTRRRDLEGISWPGMSGPMQMCMDYLFIEPPWWELLRALGSDPVRDGIDEFGSWIANHVADSYRPEGLLP